MTNSARAKSIAAAIAIVTLLAVVLVLFRHGNTAFNNSGSLNAGMPERMIAQTAMNSQSRSIVAAGPAAATEKVAAVADTVAQEPNQPAPPLIIRPDAQLVRTATISVKVTNVARSLSLVTRITALQLGDVVSLNDETPESSNDAHTATVEIRVPVMHFDETLAQLAKLGKVESQSVSAQDVSDQIIDGSARLRNLRRTEQDMLAIMDRSGSIDQVLNVEQELSSVRDQIERLTAQLESVKNQVAYSTIDIMLHQPPAVVVQPRFHVLTEAWKAALASVRDFTLGIASFGVWLIAFSPYLILAAVASLVLYRRLRHKDVAARL